MNDPAGLGHRLPGHALIDLAERVGEPTVPLRTSPGINSRNLACSIAQRGSLVALSSMGADSDKALGVIRGLRAQEQRLMKLDRVNVYLLRPVSFFENFYDQIGLIKEQGIVADSVEPDLPIPMIAARDVADAAAKALGTRDWAGTVVRELVGQRDISNSAAP